MRQSRLLLLALASLVASSTASAKGASFTVYNGTDYTLTALYTGPSTSEDWGDNILDAKVGPGGSVEVSLTNLDTCEMDFRYEFTGAKSYDEYKINVCKIDGESFTIQ